MQSIERLLLSAALALLLAGCAAPVPETPYTEQLESPGAKFAGLPPAVQNTIRAQVGGAEIEDIEKVIEGEKAIYAIHFKNDEWFPSMLVAADGSVLNENLTVAVGAPSDPIGAVSGGAVSGLKAEDLPTLVMETVRERAPSSEIGYINKFSVIDYDFYEVSFKDGRPKLLVAEDGAVVTKPEPRPVKIYTRPSIGPTAPSGAPATAPSVPPPGTPPMTETPPPPPPPAPPAPPVQPQAEPAPPPAPQR